jgi:hypothetical protein
VRGQHADAGLFDDVPDARDRFLLRHAKLTALRARGSCSAAGSAPAQPAVEAEAAGAGHEQCQ